MEGAGNCSAARKPHQATTKTYLLPAENQCKEEWLQPQFLLTRLFENNGVQPIRTHGQAETRPHTNNAAKPSSVFRSFGPATSPRKSRQEPYQSSQPVLTQVGSGGARRDVGRRRMRAQPENGNLESDVCKQHLESGAFLCACWSQSCRGLPFPAPFH